MGMGSQALLGLCMDAMPVACGVACSMHPSTWLRVCSNNPPSYAIYTPCIDLHMRLAAWSSTASLQPRASCTKNMC